MLSLLGLKRLTHRFHFTVYSDLVTSASCVPDAQKSPKTQNNLWYAFRKLKDHYFDQPEVSCLCDFCGCSCSCCLTAHTSFSLCCA